MTDNPYQPSTVLSDAPTTQSSHLRRPMGIWLIMILFLIVGTTRFGLAVYLIAIRHWLHLGLLLRLAVSVLILAAVLGMFFGRRWGWMIATMLAVLGVLDQLRAFSAAVLLPSERQVEETAMPLTLAFGLASVLVYLYRVHVLAYFRVPSEKRFSILASEVVLSVVALASWRAFLLWQFSDLD